MLASEQEDWGILCALASPAIADGAGVEGRSVVLPTAAHHWLSRFHAEGMTQEQLRQLREGEAPAEPQVSGRFAARQEPRPPDTGFATEKVFLSDS